jgi:alanyl-tRNA synthetase
MTGNEIRDKFLQYFKSKGHEIVPSSSLVPQNDPTLLFTNAGMNQFKDVFLGTEKRSYDKACSSQKVVRAGGKHNDLENVGRTARHHTFFEMLGNFSFGDYFKEKAIEYGWEFLTKEMGLPEDKLFVSIYEDDDEAFEIWNKKIGLPPEKILRMGEKDNFWSMGDTGPCGPCSEIHIDQGPEVGCGRPDCDPYCDYDRHLELWNLVFMQFDRDADGNMTPLPKPSIDTGMGLERIAAVVQGKQSNYETDLIRPIIDYIASLTEHNYGDNEKYDVSMRVIADHSRSTTFLIGDGVIPSNEGRGYVLRRIMRRAMRHAKMLGLKEAAFYKVCEFVVDFMKGHYIELADKKSYISKMVKFEEERFGKTLDAGLKVIDELMEKYSTDKIIPGKEIFKLYDTYGFPVDLLEDIAEDNDFNLDMQGFEDEMKAQQERAKKAWAGSGDDKISDIYKQMLNQYKSEFVGYENLKTDATVIALVKDDNFSDIILEGESASIVLDKTSFYPEGGGQVGDKGQIVCENGVFEVTDTKKFGNDLIVHFGKVLRGEFKKGGKVTACVDEDLRRATEKNHSATHLLHKALQVVLGDHVRQAGSLVGPDRLRFDFNHFTSITNDEIAKIETIVNEQIQRNHNVDISYKSLEDAMKSGVMALFGEKYGETVRVVLMDEFSKELCGGCHVKNTGEIGVFKILSEGSVAAGIRRIEAVTGMNAINSIIENDMILKEISTVLKSQPNQVIDKINDLFSQLKSAEKEVQKLKDKLNSEKAGELLDNVKEVNGVKVLSVRMDNTDVNSLRKFSDMAKDKLKSGIILIGSVNGDKITFICSVTKDLTGKFNAGKLVKEIAAVTGGGGGGRPDMAQAGGKDVSKVDEALNKIYELV